MANPIIANRAPAEGTTSGVEEKSRFSVRADTLEIDRGTLYFYIGTGRSFYQASSGVLPEDHEELTFKLRAWSAFPVDQADIYLSGDELAIEKLVGTNRRALYEFGGLEAPADPTDPLMLEFTLRADDTFVTQDGDDWSGIMAGFKINDTGLVVKFLWDGATGSIGLFDAAVSTVAPVVSTAFDWGDDVAHKFKLLWYPKQDLVRLYVSTGDGPTPDMILLTTTVSAFPGPLAPNEIPSVQPVAFFGHGGVTAESVAFWGNAYLYNLVTSPIQGGIYQGEHEGFIRTDNVTDYRPAERPLKTDHPWVILPDSFGTVEGVDLVTIEGKLHVTKSEPASSYGFFRYEPKVPLLVTIFDFKVAGELINRGSGLGEATGMEIYIDDGVKKAVFALLDEEGTQSVGILTGDPPNELAEYEASSTNWVNEFSFRLIFDPAGNVDLVRLTTAGGSTFEEPVISVAYADLPASDFPGPGLGFMINGNTIATQATLKLGRLRYSTEVHVVPGSALPLAPWVPIGTGAVPSSDGTAITIPKTVVGDVFFYQFPELGLDSEQGWFLEFRNRINSYQLGESVNPIREFTGVAVIVDDGTYLNALAFADGGPGLGKIVFLLTDPDGDGLQNLFDIRAGTLATAGTYAAVDWSEFHMYRIEKTVGGRLLLYIDDSEEPVLEFPQEQFTPSPTQASKAFRFGHVDGERLSESEWQFFRHNLSAGFDVAAAPVLTEEETLSRFNHAINVIAHADET